jgi:hypothetical protein
MRDDEPTEEPETIRVEEGNAGEAKQMDTPATRERSLEIGMLPEELLEERQRELATERRWGGPDLDPPTRAREEAEEEVPDVPPTETEEGPAEP